MAVVCNSFSVVILVGGATIRIVHESGLDVQVFSRWSIIIHLKLDVVQDMDRPQIQPIQERMLSMG